jgi:hypothetical protein
MRKIRHAEYKACNRMRQSGEGKRGLAPTGNRAAEKKPILIKPLSNPPSNLAQHLRPRIYRKPPDSRPSDTMVLLPRKIGLCGVEN